MPRTLPTRTRARQHERDGSHALYYKSRNPSQEASSVAWLPVRDSLGRRSHNPVDNVGRKRGEASRPRRKVDKRKLLSSMSLGRPQSKRIVIIPRLQRTSEMNEQTQGRMRHNAAPNVAATGVGTVVVVA